MFLFYVYIKYIFNILFSIFRHIANFIIFIAGMVSSKFPPISFLLQSCKTPRVISRTSPLALGGEWLRPTGPLLHLQRHRHCPHSKPEVACARRFPHYKRGAVILWKTLMGP